jgi:hypothetical protein
MQMTIYEQGNYACFTSYIQQIEFLLNKVIK